MKAAKAVRRKYNWLARIYDIIYLPYLAKTTGLAMVPSLLDPQFRYLDIGCGTGALEKKLLQIIPNLHLVGVDISEEMLEVAHKRYGHIPTIRWKHGDFTRVDLEENAFDVAFSLSNLHYFPNPLILFQRIFAVLKRGGAFLLIDWNRNSVRGKIYNGYMKKIDPAFNQVYTPQEVTNLLQQAGFNVTDTHSFSASGFWYMMRIVAKKP